MTSSRVASAAVLVACLLASPSARAETTATSTISQIKVVEPSDARYRSFHGALWLEADKATYNYRWGGSNCRNATLSAASLDLLLSAFGARHGVTVDYVSVSRSDGSYRCITAVTVTR